MTADEKRMRLRNTRTIFAALFLMLLPVVMGSGAAWAQDDKPAKPDTTAKQDDAKIVHPFVLIETTKGKIERSRNALP